MNIKFLQFSFGILLFIFLGCKSKPTKPIENSVTAFGKDSNTIAEPTIPAVINLSPVWYLDITAPGKNRMIKMREPDSAALTEQNMIKVLNLHYEKVQCFFDHRSNDTIYISIPDSEHLTQRMGSAGGEAYMAEAVFTLTEIKGVKYIHFNFEEGDHAVPGTYSRKDFDY